MRTKFTLILLIAAIALGLELAIIPAQSALAVTAIERGLHLRLGGTSIDAQSGSLSISIGGVRTVPTK
jgi:hypothetical protein